MPQSPIGCSPIRGLCAARRENRRRGEEAEFTVNVIAAADRPYQGDLGYKETPSNGARRCKTSSQNDIVRE